MTNLLQWIPFILLIMTAPLCQANTMWFCESSDDKISPISNFESVMGGYDVVMADPFKNSDPGIRKTIFDPLYTDSGRTYLRSFVDMIKYHKQCDRNFEIVSIKNPTEFSLEWSKDITYFIDLEGNNVDNNVDENKNSKFEKMLLGRAYCTVADVDIALFEKPIFTEKFKNALSTFYYASTKPESAMSKTTAVAFFRTFGTHFRRSTKMGSKILLWNQLESEVNERESSKCLLSAIKNSILKSNGEIPSLKQMFETNSSSCGKPATKNELTDSEDEDYVTKKGIVIEGNLPKSSLSSWYDEIISPVPVSFELMKISYLFRKEWLDFIKLDAEKYSVLDTEGMYSFFEENLNNYCTLKSKRPCVDGQPSKTRWNSKSEEKQPANRKYLNTLKNEVMYNDQPIKDNQIKKRQVNYSSTHVFVSGGFINETHGIKSVEELTSGPQRLNITDLPAPMGGHSFTAVGTVLYNCGGSTPWSFLPFTKYICYALDLSDQNPSWVHDFDLPHSMNNFHTALTVGSEIWFFNRGSNILHILNTKTKEFSRHKLPFKMGNYSCITMFNQTTLFAIDTSAGNVHTLENNSDPKIWSRSWFDLERRYIPVCLKVDSNIFITGDDRIDLRDNFEVYNVETNSISFIPSFVRPRIGYEMFVLEGSAAAVGGMNRTGNEIFSSVEAFNSTTNKWQIHDWHLKNPRVWFALAQLTSVN